MGLDTFSTNKMASAEQTKNFNHVLSRELFLNSIMHMDIFVCEEVSLEWSQHGISCRLKN